MKHDYTNDIDAAVVYIKFGHGKKNTLSQKEDEVVLRLLDKKKSRNKMLSIHIGRQGGKFSIHESTRTSGFFYENERDQEMESVKKPDIMDQMETDYVGFWIMYRHRSVIPINILFCANAQATQLCNDLGA